MKYRTKFGMEGNKGPKPIITRRNTNVVETRSDEEEPLSPTAKIFHAPQFNCVIVGIVGLKSRIDVDVIKKGLMESLAKHPRFSSKLVLNKGGQPTAWIKTELTIDDHVIVPELDPNMQSPDQFVEDYVSNITKTPIDLTKPLWEIHLLNIKTKEANSVAVFRIHHSLGDGISIMSLVLACTRQTANPDALPTLPIDTNKKKEMIPSSSNSLGFLSCFLGLMFILKLLWNTMIDLAKFIATSLWMKDTKTPLKGGPDVGSTPKRYLYRNLSLDHIKLVKNALNVTINDVVLGITQGGMSCYLNRKYGEIKGEGKDKKDNLPKHIRLRSSLLVNLRPTLTIENLSEKLEASGKGQWNWGNAIGYAIIPIDIAIRDDPLDYIRSAKSTIDKKKHSLEAWCTFKTAMIVLKTLGLQAIATLSHRVLSHTTLSFSNIVGPKEEISFYGHPIAFLAPSVYGHPQALTVHFQSYVDKMTLVLAIDQDVIPDPQRLCDDIEESLRLAYKASLKIQ